MASFGEKPWVNLLEKTSIFRHFKLLVFIAQKGALSLLDYRKSHFPNQYCLKKKVGKIAIFGPKPWVNPFAKMSIFRFLKLLVFNAKKGAFSFQIIIKVIFLTNIALQKRLEKWPSLDQNHGFPFGKMSIFRRLEILLFIAQKAVFSIQNIVKVIFLTYSA